ncbi:MAG: hypothetical protein HC854_11010 [Flavobacterium sp.]|nr:hypothetical protein [Flavobacterium sp.]
MKQLFLGVSIILSLATYAQKDELKTLKKIYEKEQITEEELKTYKEASDKLSSVASSESDKVYAKFYKTIFPALEFASKGENQSDSDKTKFFNPDFLAAYGSILDNTLEFEKKSGKKILTDYIIKEKAEFRDFLYASGSKLFDDKKYREASLMFHNLYVFDPKHEGLALENSAQLAVQAQDYLLAEKFYEDLRDSDYHKTELIIMPLM